jgi:transcription elongation factor GreA
VELTALGEDKTLTFTVVRTAQANPVEGKISDASPMGEAVIGRRVGDEVVALTPRGERRRYRIADVRR